jgi:hypothetical protein
MIPTQVGRSVRTKTKPTAALPATKRRESAEQNMKALKKALLFSLLAPALCLLPGCGGGGATLQTSGNKTLGQELIDLNQAYQKGLITEKEYNRTKERLIKKYTD